MNEHSEDVEPTAPIPEREMLVRDNPALAQQIREGIAEAEGGKTTYLGSFAQYLDEDDEPAKEAGLPHITGLWHDTNTRIGDASGHGNPPDPYLLAALLDGRAGLWLELARLRDADPDRSNTSDVYAVACHYAAILDQEHAARVRFEYRIPTLHPGTVASHLNLGENRCGHCGRTWQLETEYACEKCPALLFGISPASADEVGKYPAGVAWQMPDPSEEDDDG